MKDKVQLEDYQPEKNREQRDKEYEEKIKRGEIEDPMPHMDDEDDDEP